MNKQSCHALSAPVILSAPRHLERSERSPLLWGWEILPLHFIQGQNDKITTIQHALSEAKDLFLDNFARFIKKEVQLLIRINYLPLRL